MEELKLWVLSGREVTHSVGIPTPSRSDFSSALHPNPPVQPVETLQLLTLLSKWLWIKASAQLIWMLTPLYSTFTHYNFGKTSTSSAHNQWFLSTRSLQIFFTAQIFTVLQRVWERADSVLGCCSCYPRTSRLRHCVFTGSQLCVCEPVWVKRVHRPLISLVELTVDVKETLLPWNCEALQCSDALRGMSSLPPLSAFPAPRRFCFVWASHCCLWVTGSAGLDVKAVS